jgi:hypothetical protein
MIRQSSCKSGRSSRPLLLNRFLIRNRKPQSPMGPNEIKISLMQKHLIPKSIRFFGKTERLARQSPIFLTQGQVMAFDKNRGDSIQGNVPISALFEDPDHVAPLISFLYHLTITKFRTGNPLRPTRPTSFPSSRVPLQNTMPLLQGISIGIHPIADPNRPNSLLKTLFGSRNQGLGHLRLLAGDPKRKHQPIFPGKGNPDPRFPFQRVALWRNEFFLTNVHKASNSIWETLTSLRSKASTFSLWAAASWSQCRTVSNFTSNTSPMPRRGMPFTRSFNARRTFSSGVRRS